MTLFSMFLLRGHGRGCKPGQDLFPVPAILLSRPARGSLLESRLRFGGWQGAGGDKIWGSGRLPCPTDPVDSPNPAPHFRGCFGPAL